MSKNKYWIGVATVFAGLLMGPAAQARLVSDGSKKVLVVNISYDTNGASKSKVMTLGEFTVSTKYGFQVQGLYDEIQVLRVPADAKSPAADIFPDVPALALPSGLGLDALTGAISQSLAADTVRWGENTAINQNGTLVENTLENRKVLSWMKKNGVSKAILSFSQDYLTAPSESDGAAANAKVYATKVLNIDGRSYWTGPLVEVPDSQMRYINAIYYPSRLDIPIMDPRIAPSSTYTGTPGGLYYEVLQADGTPLGPGRYANAASGAFDSWNAYEQPGAFNQAISEELFIDCAYMSREQRHQNALNSGKGEFSGDNTNIGGPFSSGWAGRCPRSSAKPGYLTGDDLYRIMGRNNAMQAGFTYLHRPRVKVQDAANTGAPAPVVTHRLTQRSVEFRGCTARYQQSGTFDVAVEHRQSNWVVNLDGSKFMLGMQSDTSTVSNLDYDLRKFTAGFGNYITASLPPPSFPGEVASIDFNRVLALSMVNTPAADPMIFDPVYKWLIYPASLAYSLNGGNAGSPGALPALQVIGNKDPVRVNKTYGSAVFKAECNDKGTYSFTASNQNNVSGKIDITLGRATSKANQSITNTMSWETRENNYATKPMGFTWVNPQCRSYEECFGRYGGFMSQSDGLSQDSFVSGAGAVGARTYVGEASVTDCKATVRAYTKNLYATGQYFETSEPWMNEDPKVGNSMTSLGSNCGNLYQDLKQLATYSEDTGICPPGYDNGFQYADFVSCAYGSKTVCTILGCTSQTDYTVWKCLYSGYNTSCAKAAIGGTCGPSGLLVSVYDSLQGSPLTLGLLPSLHQVCKAKTQQRLYFWVP